MPPTGSRSRYRRNFLNLFVLPAASQAMRPLRAHMVTCDRAFWRLPSFRCNDRHTFEGGALNGIGDNRARLERLSQNFDGTRRARGKMVGR